MPVTTVRLFLIPTRWTQMGMESEMIVMTMMIMMVCEMYMYYFIVRWFCLIDLK